MMRTLCFGLVTLALILQGRVAYAQRPMPGPAQAPLLLLVGVWHFDGEAKAVPAVSANDAGPVHYTHVNEMVHDGFFLETHRTGIGPSGPVSELFVYGWDESAKVYRQDGYNNRGQIRRFTGTLDGHTWRFTGTNTSASGRVTYERFTVTYDPDMVSASLRSEHSADGAQWFERLTGRYTKASPEESGR
jgi:hypothetical protein